MQAYKDDELIAQGEGPLDELSDFAKSVLKSGKADRVEISTKSFKERVRDLAQYGCSK